MNLFPWASVPLEITSRLLPLGDKIIVPVFVTFFASSPIVCSILTPLRKVSLRIQALHLKSVLWLATTVALPPHDVIGCRVSSRVDCLGGVQRAANLARFNADARLHVQATIQRIWLLLVVNGGTFELVPLGIGSA